MFGKITLFAACLIFSAGAVQSGPATLDSLIAAALENNQKIAAAHYSARAVREESSARDVLPDPQLMLSAMNLPSRSLALDETPMSGIQIGLSQITPWPGKLSARGKIAQLQSEIARINITSTENRIVRLMRQAYFEYSFWIETEQLMRANIALLENISDIVEVRYANGEALARDFLRAEIKISKLENDLTTVEEKSAAALAMIEQLTGSETASTGRPPAELPPYGQDNLSTDNVGFTNPLLKKSRLQTQASEKTLALAKANYWPDLMIGFDYRFRRDIPMDPIGGDDFISFKVGLKLPLYFWARQDREKAAADARLMAARQQETDLELELRRQTTEVNLALRSTASIIESYEAEIIPQAEAAVEAAQAAYEVGKADFDAYLNSQLDLLNMKMEYLRQLKKLNQSKALLAELHGIPFAGGRK